MASKIGTGRKLLVLLSSLALVIGLVAPAAMTVGADAIDDALVTLDLVSVQGAGIKTAADPKEQDLRYYTTLLADIDTLKTTLGVEEVTVTEYGTIFKPTQKMTDGEALTLESEGIAVAKATGTWSDTDAPAGFYAVLSDSADGTHAGVRVSARSYVTLSFTANGDAVTKTVYSNNGNEANTIVAGQASRSVYMVGRAMLTAMQERADDIAWFRGSAIAWTDAVTADSAPADVVGADILAFLSSNVEAAEVLSTLPPVPDYPIVLEDGTTSLGTWTAENGGTVGTTEYGYNGKGVMLSRNGGAGAIWNQLTLTEPLAVKAGDIISLKVYHTENLAAGWWFWLNDTESTENNYFYGIDGTYAHRYIYYPTNTDLVAGDGIAPETWGEISYTVKADATISNIRIMTEYNGSNGYFIIDDFMVTKPEGLPEGMTILDDGNTTLGTWAAYDGGGAVGYTDSGYNGTSAAMLSRNSGGNAIWSQLTLNEPLTVEADDIISFRLYHTENTAAGLWVAFFDENGAELKYFYGIDGTYAHRYIYYPTRTDLVAGDGIAPETWGEVSYTGLSGNVKYIRVMTEFNGSNGYYIIDDLMVTKPVSSGTWTQDKFYMSSAFNPWTLEDMQAYKEAGYNLAECGNFNLQQMEECLDSAETVGGVDVLFSQKSIQLPNEDGFTSESVYRVVSEYKNYDSLLGYHVWDEITPGQNRQNYTLANSLLKTLKLFDPNSLRYMTLLPSYGAEYTWELGNYASYVEDYIQTTNPQVLSFDYYPYLVDGAGDTDDWWRDLGLFRKKSLEHDLPFWYYYQACCVNDDDYTPTETEIKYQMYVGLAYGAKYLSAWNGQWDGVYGAFNYNGGKTELYDTVKARNAELRPIGEYLFDKTTTHIYHVGDAASYTDEFYLDDLSQSDIIRSVTVKTGLFTSGDAIISVFTDGKTDTKYLLVVNKSTENALYGGSLGSSKIQLKSTKNISYFDPATKSEVSLGSGTTIDLGSLPAGGGKVFVLK